MSFKRNAVSVAIATALTTPLIGYINVAAASDEVVVAQAQAGTVQGRVVDASGGHGLQGAMIRVVGTNYEATTARDGSYRLPALPAGTYEVRFSFMGYDTQTLTVEVGAGQRETLDVSMSGGVFTLEGMEVLGMRGAQARALNQQRASDKIVNVVSADTLGDFPDESVAESVARIPGVSVTRHRGDADNVVIRGGNPEWTKVTVDGLNIGSAGAGRNVQLGQINSEVISAVEVTKAPTPDMDADAIGGTVNIVTRGALDSDGTIIQGKLAGGYSELGGKTNYDAGLTLGTVVGDHDRYGFMISLGKNRIEREMNNVENDFTKVDGVWLPDGTNTKAYDIVRERSVMEARVDYESADRATHLYAAYTRNEYEADEDRHNISISERRGFTEGSTFEQGGWNRTRIDQNWRDRHDKNTQDLFRVGGSRDFDGVEWDFAGAYSQADARRLPGRKSWTWRGEFDSIDYDYSNPDFPVFTWRDSGQIPNVGPDGNVNPDDLSFRYGSNYLEDRTQKEKAFQAQTNVLIPVEFGDYFGSLKFGAKLTDRTRDSDYNRHLITGGAPDLRDLLTDKEINNFGRFPYGYRFNKGAANRAMSDLEFLDPEARNSIYRAYSSDYKVEESIYAGYGMGTVDLGDLRLIGGVRLEHTKTNSEGYRSLDDWETIPDRVNFKRSYTDLFPALHAKYDLTENTILRAAFTTGIGRPSFSDLRPTTSVNEMDQEISTYNMGLKPEKSQAIDLMVEHYFEPIGLLSAGVFYKRIKDVHFNTTRDAEVGENFNGFVVPEAGWSVSERVNSDSMATITGIELAWDQALTFLPAPFDGLGVFANYTYTDSKAKLPGSGETVPLGAQPDHTYNLAVYYEKAGFSTRLAYNYQTARIQSYGSNAEEHVWWDDRGILDLTASYRINDNFTVYAEANNLTDSYGRRYQAERKHVDELEGFGRSYMVGVRFNF